MAIEDDVVTVEARFPAEVLATVRDWIYCHPYPAPAPTLSEAIVRLVGLGLAADRPAGQTIPVREFWHISAKMQSGDSRPELVLKKKPGG